MAFLSYACTFTVFYTKEIFYLFSVHKCHHVQGTENDGVNLGAASKQLQSLEYTVHNHRQ